MVPLRFTQIPETKPSLAKFQKLRKPAGRYITWEAETATSCGGEERDLY